MKKEAELRRIAAANKSALLANKPAASTTNDEFISKILSNTAKPSLDPLLGAQGGAAAMAAPTESRQLVDLKLSSFVIEMEFIPKPKVVTYDREIDVQTDLSPVLDRATEEHHIDNLASISDDRSKKAS